MTIFTLHNSDSLSGMAATQRWMRESDNDILFYSVILFY